MAKERERPSMLEVPLPVSDVNKRESEIKREGGECKPSSSMRRREDLPPIFSLPSSSSLLFLFLPSPRLTVDRMWAISLISCTKVLWWFSMSSSFPNLHSRCSLKLKLMLSAGTKLPI